MMKQILIILISCLITFVVSAQESKLSLSIHAEAGIPNQGNTGFGFFLKGGVGVSKTALLTLQAGFSRFSADGLAGHKATAIKVIPLLAGFQYHFKDFYLEPQIGYGALNSRVDIGGDYARHSHGAFYWAMGAGYQLKQLIIGVRYQSAVGKAYLGAERKDQFGFIGINVGYQLFK